MFDINVLQRRLRVETQTLADIHDEVQAAVVALAQGQTGAATKLSQSRARLKAQVESIDDMQAAMSMAVQFLASPDRTADRVRVHKESAEVVARAKRRVELAKKADKAVRALAEAIGQLVDEGVAINDGLVKQLKLAYLDPQQRLESVGYLHGAGRVQAGGFNLAAVLALDAIFGRLENPRHVYEPAPGHQFTPGQSTYSFEEAVAQQSHDLEFHLGQTVIATVEAEEELVQRTAQGAA
jgi:hypothetical protein